MPCTLSDCLQPDVDGVALAPRRCGDPQPRGNAKWLTGVPLLQRRPGATARSAERIRGTCPLRLAHGRGCCGKEPGVLVVHCRALPCIVVHCRALSCTAARFNVAECVGLRGLWHLLCPQCCSMVLDGGQWVSIRPPGSCVRTRVVPIGRTLCPITPTKQFPRHAIT
jgi:hypothetical protein